MQVAGVNKRADRNDIAEGESPDAVNCFFAKDKLGTLGARKGKTAVNSTAYDADVYGVGRLILPSGRHWMVGQNDGDSEQENAPLATEPAGFSDPSVQLFTFNLINSSFSWPAGDEEIIEPFHNTTGIPAGTYEAFIPITYSTTVTWSGGTENGNYNLNIRFLDASDNQLAGILLEDFVLPKTSVYTPANLSWFRKQTITLSTTATKIQTRLAVSGGIGATYSATCGPFHYVVVKKG